MKVSIDRTVCQGHGLCAGSAPGIFAFDDEGYGLVTSPEVGADERLVAQVRAAVAACPELAISIDE